jgi:hypothetical protein
VAGGVLLRVPLPVMTVIIAGLALGVEVLGLVAGLGRWSLALLAIPGVLAAAYLLEYRTLPYEPWHPAPRRAASAPAASLTPGTEEEEFVDPVEEADRLDRAGAPDATADSTDAVAAPGSSGEPE